MLIVTDNVTRIEGDPKQLMFDGLLFSAPCQTIHGGSVT